MATPFTYAVYYFIICKDSTQSLAPVYFSKSRKSETIIHQDPVFFFCSETIPFISRKFSLRLSLTVIWHISGLFKNLCQLFNPPGSILFFIIPAVKYLQVYPLRPFIIFGITGTYF